jgi:dolichol-phosphate mannosyltransferase
MARAVRPRGHYSLRLPSRSSHAGPELPGDGTPTHPLVTVVIPLKDEAGNVAELHRQIQSALDGWKPYEVVAVDDGSADDTWRCLQDAVRADPRWTAVRHRTTRGKSAALATAFTYARGDIVATMDGDLQDDPAEIPAMTAQLDESYDLVSGWKVDRKDPLGKTLPSRFFNWVTRQMTGLRLHDFNCGLKVYRAEIARGLRLYGELHRYIPVIAHAHGYRVTEQPVRHRERRWGSSKYGWARLLKGALDLMTILLVTRFSTRPLHLLGSLSALAFAVGVASALLAPVTAAVGLDLVPGTLSEFAALIAIQLLIAGLIMELVVADRHRPTGRMYVAKVCVNDDVAGIGSGTERAQSAL